MSRARRIRLFIRDWWEEMPLAWSIARMRDCERSGGHQWGEMHYDEVFGSYRSVCQRCGTGDYTLPTTTGTTATNTTTTYRVSP
jgi:hypothetical protein